MKIFCWVVFGLFLLNISGFDLKEVVAAPKYSDIGLITSKEEIQESEEKVLVIKQAELKSLVNSIKGEYKTYAATNRYERIDKAAYGIDESQLEKKITGSAGPTILTVDKPLVLGGDGFNKSSFDYVENKIEFTFYSHIKPIPVYANEKNIARYIDPTAEGARNKKFLIFRDSGLSFGREPDVFVEPIPKQFVKRKVTYTKVSPILETQVYLGLNSKVKVNLSSTQKPLDLIQDNPAMLKYDYEKLSASGH
jgi:hypothetical protein